MLTIIALILLPKLFKMPINKKDQINTFRVYEGHVDKHQKDLKTEDVEELKTNDSEEVKKEPKHKKQFKAYKKEDLKRILTISYTYDKENETLKYACCIYKNDNPSEVFVKKAHRATSLARLAKRPVIITNFADNNKSENDGKDEEFQKIEEFRKRVRKLIFTHGVCSKKIPSSKTTSQQSSQPVSETTSETIPDTELETAIEQL